jgi:ubiquinone/menaquinone biosynthesis C-methylase UbiE
MADEVTRRLMPDAAVREGMRVLDIGCGRGNVAVLAAGLVGPSGWVLGIDSDSTAIESADARVRCQSARNLDPVSASNLDPFTVCVFRCSRPELRSVAEQRRA